MSTARKRQALVEVFQRRDEKGERVYSDEAVSHLLPALLLSVSGGLEPDEVPQPVLDVLDNFCAKLELPPDCDADTFRRRIEEWYREHPIEPALAAEVAALLREQSADTDTSQLREAAKMLGVIDDDKRASEIVRSNLNPLLGYLSRRKK